MFDLTHPATANPALLDTFVSNPGSKSVQMQSNRAVWVWRFWFLTLMGFSVAVGLLMWRSGPSYSTIAWLLYLIGFIVILLKPRYGLYLVIFFTLVGDPQLTYWYPFAKNFSSRESLLYLHNAIIVSPLETYIILLFISWLGRGVVQRQLRFYTGSLFWPIIIFTGFMLFGLMWGISRGGNLNIALWESRAIFYMSAVLILSGNLLEKPEHVSTFVWFAIAAVFVESLVGNHFYFFVLKRDLSLVDRIAAHAATIHLNTFFVLLLSSYFFRASLVKRLSLPLMLPFIALTFIAMQRRAGFLTLGIAFVLLIIILYQENRRLFFVTIPALAIAGIIYIGVFWNASGALGLPAQAVKSVLFPSQATAEDQSSDYYRYLESVNIDFTIHQAPLTGVGFGNPFYIIAPMPDISFFVFWQYITHNSIVWIWMKAGVGGFFSMIFLIGWSLITAIQVFLRLLDPDLKTIMFTAIVYVIMHFTYAYVDMSWDIESMVYLGGMLGIINGMERIASQPISVPTRRWPWQSKLEPIPKIRP